MSLALLIFANACATPRLAYEDVVSIKELKVVAVDGTVDEEVSLSEWLEARAMNEVVAWDSHDCGEQTGDPATTPSDFPICAEATFSNCNGARSSIAIVVGTFKRGVSGRPQIFWATSGKHDSRTLREFAADNPVCARTRNRT